MPRPSFTLEQASELAATHFGLAQAVASQLPSYDDQNFKVCPIVPASLSAMRSGVRLSLWVRSGRGGRERIRAQNCCRER